jgi:hypothetical protein
MTDPPKLLEGGSEIERAILGSWGRRQPASGAHARVLAAVGATAGLPTATASPGASASLAPAKAAVLTSSTLAKWLAVVLAFSAAAGLAGYVVLRPRTSPPPLPPVSVSPALSSYPAPSQADPTAAEPPPGAEHELSVTGTVATTNAPGSAVAPPAVRKPAAGEPSSLVEQVQMIDRARQADRANDPIAAIAELDAYEARFPAGLLNQEAAEIRIDALLRKGDRALADQLAARFLARYPASPYAREIRARLPDAKARVHE